VLPIDSRVRRVSAMPAAMTRGESGRRSSFASVSGRRKALHKARASPYAPSMANIHRQLARASTAWPRLGASTGTTMKMIIALDMICAIAAP
jgi:hypothetical protein